MENRASYGYFRLSADCIFLLYIRAIKQGFKDSILMFDLNPGEYDAFGTSKRTKI